MALCGKLHSGQVAFAADKRLSAPRTVFQGAKLCTRVVNISQGRRVAAPVVCQATTVEAPQGKDLLNSTYYPTSADAANVTKPWVIINAEGKTLGRLAVLAAMYIRGKNSPTYTPSMDMGSYVIVINADKVQVTGSKFTDKTYFNHVTGRPGSYRVEAFKDLQRRLPERIIERAVKGMLPKGRLGRDIRLHLKVYKGDQHPHVAQQPNDVTNEIDIRPRNGPGAALLAAKKAAAQ